MINKNYYELINGLQNRLDDICNPNLKDKMSFDEVLTNIKKDTKPFVKDGIGEYKIKICYL